MQLELEHIFEKIQRQTGTGRCLCDDEPWGQWIAGTNGAGKSNAHGNF